MRKIFLYILCFNFIVGIFSSQAFANTCLSSCKISDSPSPKLTQYLDTLGQISEKLTEQLSQREEELREASEEEENLIWIEKDIKNTKTRVLRAFNSILSFKEHYGSFDFWISTAITNEITAPVKRDHAMLQRETEKLTHILEKSAHRGSITVKITDICSGIQNCSIPDGSAWDILALLINNNKLITQLYQASILEKPWLDPIQNIRLVPEGFTTEIKSYYNKDTLTECSRCEEGSLANFREKIQNISFKNNEYKEGLAKWKAAWAMLRGGDRKASQKLEESLLADYLQWQGISPTQAETVIWNLKRYNENGLSSSDPLTNSSNYTQANINQEIQTFQQAMLEAFQGEEKVPFVELWKVNTEIKTTANIQKEIHSLFEDQKPFAFTQDVASQQLQLRIIKMHFSLIRSINMLEKYKSVATDACNTPWGWGKCDNY